jgi:hypothetical protein
MIDLSREICKPALKLNSTAHGIMMALSVFQLRTSIFRLFFKIFASCISVMDE